jgi:hypothetical protein
MYIYLGQTWKWQDFRRLSLANIVLLQRKTAGKPNKPHIHVTAMIIAKIATMILCIDVDFQIHENALAAFQDFDPAGKAGLHS